MTAFQVAGRRPPAERQSTEPSRPGRSQMLGDRSSRRGSAVCVVARRCVDSLCLLSCVRLHATLPFFRTFFCFDICHEMRFWTLTCPEARDATPLENLHVLIGRDTSATLARYGLALMRHCGPPVLRRPHRYRGGQNQSIEPREISGRVPKADNRETVWRISGCRAATGMKAMRDIKVM